MKSKILLADDSPTIVKVVGSILEQQGYEVVTASDGVEAAETAFRKKPDLILLDVMMPRMNGYQVCRLLKNEHSMSHVPIVILTSRDQPRDKFWGYQTGADEFVTKGYDQQRLLQVVEELLKARERKVTAEADAPGTGTVDILALSNDLLDRKLFEATVVNEVAKLTTALQNYEQTVDAVLSLIHRLVDFTTAGLALMHEDEGEMWLKMWTPVKRDYIEELKRLALSELNQYTKASMSFRGFRPQLLYAEGLGTTSEAEDAPEHVEGLLFIPILSKGTVMGGLIVTSAPGRRFSKEDESTLQLIATHAYVVIENAWLYEQVKKISITDGLTRVYNRRYLEERLDQEFKRSLRHKTYLTVLMMDIDHFKKINDQYGHQAGDFVLRKLMELCRQVTRTTDIVGRYGGEEFMVLLTETDINGGVCVAERLRKVVESHAFECDGGPIRATISLGLASIPCDGITQANQLVKAADQALYRAKESGRNRVCIALAGDLKVAGA